MSIHIPHQSLLKPYDPDIIQTRHREYFMSSPPLTSAELSKFKEACKTNNRTAFDKYYKKMQRYNLGAQEHINTAEDSIKFAIVNDNTEMFDQLLSVCQHGVGRFLWGQILDHSIPNHLWAIETALKHPHLPALDYKLQGMSLQQLARHQANVTPVFEWLVSNTRPMEVLEAAILSSTLKQWEQILFISPFLSNEYMKWRVGFQAAVDQAPHDVLSVLFENVDEHQTFKLFDERKEKFSSDEYAAIWLRLTGVYSHKQAQRITEELHIEDCAQNTLMGKRKM